MEATKDKYDVQIERLTDDPTRIVAEWSDGRGLFEFATKGFDTRLQDGSCGGGCLTMIRSGNARSETPELTAAIRSDDRLPSRSDGIRLEHLPAFAEWQRKLDLELGRTA